MLIPACCAEAGSDAATVSSRPNTREQGLTFVHIRAQLEQLQDTSKS
jgi:hypothetical protein